MSNYNHTHFVSPIKYNLDILSIAVRDTSLSTIVTKLQSILSEIECLRFEYERTNYGTNGEEIAKFILNYGTLPKIRTLSAEQKTYYKIFGEIMFDACELALQRFPHNKEDVIEFDMNNLPGPPIMPRSWCLLDINILFNQPHAPDSIILEFFRMSGDRNTKHYIYRYVKGRLEQELQVIKPRLEYLSLMEGCKDAPGHITHYLFDYYMSRDVCSYIVNELISYENDKRSVQ